VRLGCGRKPLDQGIDACACSPQPGLKGIAFVGELLELLLQIAVVLLQGVVARQQALYAVGDLLDVRRRCHGEEILLIAGSGGSWMWGRWCC